MEESKVRQAGRWQGVFLQVQAGGRWQAIWVVQVGECISPPSGKTCSTGGKAGEAGKGIKCKVGGKVRASAGKVVGAGGWGKMAGMCVGRRSNG